MRLTYLPVYQYCISYKLTRTLIEKNQNPLSVKILLLLILSLTLVHKSPTKVEHKVVVATCYGDSPCKACSNCSSCKYCNAGGSCGICSANSNQARARAISSTKTTNYVGQCKATTKKGSRCKRNGNGSGYCWQHIK
ncbi:DUF5763 domain-containing protein [Pedobacter duraquae]|uniref:DUF5763 domain-containing protein n=1 Tax=Pedobacter duraquae TaxID=425511 RepID=UPI003741E8E3